MEFSIMQFVYNALIGAALAILIVGLINPYKSGQIDCINGNIKYELVEQADGSNEWETKK